MNDEVHAATYVTKTHTTNVATFFQNTNPDRLISTKSEVIYSGAPYISEYYPIKDPGYVYLLKAYAGNWFHVMTLLPTRRATE